MSAFGDGRRTAAKGSTGDAEESGGPLNARSFQLPKTCSFRLPLTHLPPVLPRVMRGLIEATMADSTG